MEYAKRGLYIDEQRLEAYGENAARGLEVGAAAGCRASAQELRRALSYIGGVRDSMLLKWEGLRSMPDAVRWLLDNFYLAQHEGKAAALDIAAAPKVPHCPDRPVIGMAAAAIAASGIGEVTPARCELFLRGFQRRLMLSGAELALLPAFLRHALVLLLRDVCSRLADGDADGQSETMAAIFTSLRLLATEDLGLLLEKCDCTESALRSDPAGVYPRMDEATRSYYRAETARLARRWHVSEYKVAQRLISLANAAQGAQRHVGWWIFEDPLGMSGGKKNGSLYISALLLLTLFFSLLLGFAAGSPATFFLILLPLSELVKSVLDFAILRARRPRRVPRLELRGGVPDGGRTLCVVSTLLTGANDGDSLARRIEEYSLANRDCGKNLLFGILADLPDTDSAELPGSELWIERARNAVAGLNEKYGGGFYLFLRERVLFDGRWMGRERKRGAIDSLMHLLRGGAGEMKSLCSEPPQGVKYVLALDADTRLEPETAREMIGAMLHPLNSPVVDPVKKRVTRGHGVISPRIAVDLESAGRSDFSRVFAGPGGTDPYGCACGEVYMDLFQSGGFAGKGIIDVDAYLACLPHRVPDGLVLSHDAIEGAYLRGGYMSDTELTDGFPANALSYYRRLHRWVRGDWQNSPWIFRRGRDLPELERFKLLDSLRRSLVPVLTLAAMVCGFFFRREGTLLAALAALAACFTQLFITLGETLLRRDDGKIRFHSAVYFGIGGGLVRTFLRLVLLPVEAWFSLSAVCQALWRLLVTHSGLLSWQTAGQADRVRSPLVKLHACAWPVFPLSLALILLSGSILGRACGVIWLFSPFFAWVLGLPSKKEPPILPRDEAYLRVCASEIFRYFDSFLREEDNYLPPDNFQQRPPVGLARRTSPTNIGLALLSLIAASDLEVGDVGRCFFLAEKLIASVERLDKWNGHLYNWYATDTLAPLTPRYVSTVDSGNLCACLYAAESAMREYGRGDLAARCRALCLGMSFRDLYDERKLLFNIGIDIENGKKSDSWYDLLSSEARLTAYLAIARGDVPRRHWRRLSRAQRRKNGYRGMASWTGTMFEYLMPELFLPLYRDSHLYESAQFCLYVQRGRVFGTGLPWGTSESAFAALDSSMVYRYKAHGCAALALKRGMDDELVISPYSTFLALPHSPRSAMRNLRRLDRAGLRGPYGFWEALDFTPSRRSESGPSIVRCAMSHHAGMSMLSIANYLLDGVFVRRFMAEPCMSAYTGLLQEKVPLDAVVLRLGEKEVPQATVRISDEMWSRSGEYEPGAVPDCHLLANEQYNIMLTSSGISRARWGEVAPYLSQTDGRCGGLRLTLSRGGADYGLLPGCAAAQCPAPGEGVYSWEFSALSSTVKARHPGIMSTVTTLIPRYEPGEVREITISPEESAGEKCVISLDFQAVLTGNNDYVNHPAFYKLGLSARLMDGALMIRRLPRGSRGEMFLCVACDEPCRFWLEPYLFSGRSAERTELGAKELFLTEPVFACRAEPAERADGTLRCRFALCLGGDERSAFDSAQRSLRAAHSDFSALPQQAASVIGLDSDGVDSAFSLLSRLAFPALPAESDAARRENLWKSSISGDYPIVCADFSSAEDTERARSLMQMHLLLSGCGFDFDLVFITSDGASYRKPLYTALSDALWREGGEALYGARGGVHIIDEADARAVRQCAAADLSSWLREGGPLIPGSACLPSPGPASGHRRAAAFSVPEYEWSGGSFEFYVNSYLPPRAWSLPLTNGRFGYLAADSGLGNMWFVNSRENQLTPWLCDPAGVRGPERLLLRISGENISLFAENDAYPCRVTFSPGAARWEKELGAARTVLTAFVPIDTDARVFVVECAGLPPGCELVWSAELVMSSSHSDARYVSSGFSGGVFAAVNPRAIASARPFCALTSPAAEDDGSQGPHLRLRLRAGESCVLVCGCDEPKKLKALCSADGARRALDAALSHWRGFCDGFRLKSGGALDKTMNFIPYQTLACRLMARCSVYQSGGAYGFRDQLQDAANLLHLDPSLCRVQLLRSCAHQYYEGDVQHWWHEGGAEVRGVRTRCSDDLLWLPWALCEYCERTGDLSVCGETTPYLVSPPLREDERDRYEAANSSELSESVLRHALRAVELVLARGAGGHGLLRFGSGDWNDGFDEVRGESTWLTWFFCHTVSRLASLLESLGVDGAQRLRGECSALAAAANGAFDGKWFLRGYYADGSPLGGSGCRECRIDSIAQSFAAFCPEADPDKVTQALDSAVTALFDTKNGIVKLFDPPFSGGADRGNSPGYIASYGPGFRENGGQYTHGALWLVRAMLHRGETGEALRLLEAILPADKDPAVYRAEPFVAAADVYSSPGHEGEAGWSWYTGSAGWLFRIVAEDLLGLRLRGGRLFVEPRLPNYELSYLGREIRVRDSKVTVDGRVLRKGESVGIFSA